MSTSRVQTIEAANAALMVRGELDEVATYFDPGYRAHLTERQLTGGHAAIRKVVGALRRSFPELEVTVEILVEGPDRVAWQRTLRGVHREAFRGFPATGRVLVWRDMVTSRFEGDRIAEEWLVTDLAERLLSARKGKRKG